MTQTATNPHFPVSSAALSALHTQKTQMLNWKDVEARCLAFAKQVLGDELFQAACFYDNEDTGVYYLAFGDELELTFILGATPEDDYFLVSFLEVTSPRAARSLAGIGMAIENAKHIIRDSGMSINSYLEYIHLTDEE
jgi:hypothetical protein